MFIITRISSKMIAKSKPVATMYLDNVLPRKYGIQKPLLFLLSYSTD